MKLACIRPNLFADRSGDALQPLVFAILAGLARDQAECVLYDERLEPIPTELDADLVAMTAETFTARRAYQLASHFERRGTRVVLGGYHPTFCPQEALQYAHTVVLGDAEDAWPRLLADFRRGQLQRVYFGGEPTLAQRPINREIFRGKRYKPIALVQFGRGCRYACDFCSIHAFYGSRLRWRPVEEVVAELATIREPYVFITDDNLFNDRVQLATLLAAIKPLRLRWSCQASLDVAADRELLQQLADAGCISVMVGFESLDPRSLRQMRKSWNRRYGSYAELVRAFRDHGIMIYGGFVLGYDHDTRDTFAATLEFALENKLFLANFNPLTPTPGAALYGRLQAEGRLRHDRWWLSESYRYGDGLFEPRHMTAEDLTRGCYEARTAFNTYASILRRACDLRANCRTPLHAGAYFLANWTSRREIHRKQGRPLGDADVPLEPVYPEVPLAEIA